LISRFAALFILLHVAWSHAAAFYGKDSFDIVIIGGGASGTAAALTTARMSMHTALVEETTWLGGMLTAAGVSAFDGNHRISGGIFREFRDSLYKWYGGPGAVETGWVSNTLFEPHVGNRIFHNMVAREKRINLFKQYQFKEARFENGYWRVLVREQNGTNRILFARVLLDATELGDVAASLGVQADIGMDCGPETREWFAPIHANNIVQDLTWVAILKEYSEGSEHLLLRPDSYNPEQFRCACDTRDPSTRGSPLLDCRKMLDYGRLPNGRYMINWPNCGNDIYLNVVSMSGAERSRELKKAKDKTLAFVYFLQHELGFTRLGLDDTIYPTSDHLPLIPYHRESRRIKGMARLKVNHILEPFKQDEAYYRTGVAVGDYPIDHHHKQNPETPPIDFINIKASSYNIPMGVMIPQIPLPLLVAEKSISVSNIVNGTTRLQPVVLGIGQAAGALAAISVKNNILPSLASVREVQQALLDQGAYIMPYIDVPPSDPEFQMIQRVGASGLLRGTGIPYKWANQTWFYPDSLCFQKDLAAGWSMQYPTHIIEKTGPDAFVSVDWLYHLLKKTSDTITADICIALLQKRFSLKSWSRESKLSRREVAFLTDAVIDPFSSEVDLNGHFIKH
jgi:hypothetical protein